jgi:predicted RNase H-like HicB family nuclease
MLSSGCERGAPRIKSSMPDRKPSRSAKGENVTFNIETERETDGRWIAEVTNIPGVLAYGATEDAAKANAYALALRVIADQVETSQHPPKTIKVATSA